MPCGSTCACMEEPGVECLSVVDPVNFGYFRAWCESGTEAQRRAVLGRSRIGLNPVPVPAPVGQPAPASQPAPTPAEWLAQVPLAKGKPCCGGQPPGLLVKAANFAKAAFEHVKAGSPEADESTASARLAICLGCEHLNAHAMTCNLCGCSMPRKVYWGTARCPIGKW